LNIAGAPGGAEDRVGIENVFAITGDFPKGAGKPRKRCDLDSVNWWNSSRSFASGAGFRSISPAAVSPFKYTEADCAYQYLKLEKKIAAGGLRDRSSVSIRASFAS
jgi:5,10-methylenetetrahydrofolate reductase